jgi:hypothetical protein
MKKKSIEHLATTRNVLIGVAALGALGVIAYAMSGSSATTSPANFGPGVGPGGKIQPG